MKFSYKIFPEAKLVAMRAVGNTTLQKITEAYSSAYNDPLYDPSYSGVADWREANSTLSPKDVGDLAEWVIKNRLATGRWAILVAEPMVTAYAMLYIKKVNTLFPNEVYSDIRSASNYLGMHLQPFLDQV